MNYIRLGTVGAFTSLILLAQSSSEMKHLPLAPMSGPGGISVSAREIERGPQYPSEVHLTGAVEIKIPVCVRSQSGPMVCDGEMVLRADEAEFDESTGRIEARGNVSVTPTHHR
jgi:lipopolysaccharide assembly outer membrane protein LptD (OstA)